MFAEPTFIVSLSGMCGFILVVEDGEVDAYTPSGEAGRSAVRVPESSKRELSGTRLSRHCSS